MNDQKSPNLISLVAPFLFLLLVFCVRCSSSKEVLKKADTDLKTPFEKNEDYSASYNEAIQYYKKLAAEFSEVAIFEIGLSDSGWPLHAVVIGDDVIHNKRDADKTVLLINNGIHPGEPCGIDASMMMARDLVTNPDLKMFLQKTVVVIIPVYNISGSLNRGSYSRANQNGPAEYGFRGNIRNYDLNRDFIKCDTKNAQTFNRFFNRIDPDVFIDNHTSNGADYQYVITLIATQKDKLHPILSDHMTRHMLPDLYQKMEDKNYEMIPYVFSRNTPDDGIAGFLDLPRYSSGYAALHHTFSFMPETHMLKPYKDRVWATYNFTASMLEYLYHNGAEVISNRKKAKEASSGQKDFPINWVIDFEKAGEIKFKGYEAAYKPSEVTGKDRLFYDHERPFEKNIPFLNTYKTTQTVQAPSAYIIPSAYSGVIDRLRWNNVEMDILSKDTIMDVEVYYIDEMKSGDMPYEGHYLHSNVKLRSDNQQIKYYKGDIIIPVNQSKNRYIVEVLEPQGPDSFFAWNFMDGIMMQKEYFSSYVFEETALMLLEKDADLKTAFEQKKAADADFAGNGRAQLNFIYERSPYYEKSYKRYPIARIK